MRFLPIALLLALLAACTDTGVPGSGASRAPVSSEQECQAAFKQLDRNGDGRLPTVEFYANGQVSRGFPDPFTVRDTNRDNLLDESEFCAAQPSPTPRPSPETTTLPTPRPMTSAEPPQPSESPNA